MRQQNRALAALEIYAVVKEIEPLITNSLVKKVYHLKDNVYVVLHRGKDFMLLLAPERLHITNYKEKFPQEPSNFCMFLRKHIDGAVLKSVKQHDFERIVEFHFTRKDKEYFLIGEFFGDGNVLLLNSKREIMGGLKQRDWKDRSVKRGEVYAYPPPAINLQKINEREIERVLGEEKTEVVRVLARKFGLGGLYAEEICARTGIDKKTPANSLTGKHANVILKEIQNIFTELDEIKKGFHYFEEAQSEGVWSQNEGDWLAYHRHLEEAHRRSPSLCEETVELSPIKLQTFSALRSKEFGSFSEACDEFFITTRLGEIVESENKVRKKFELILDSQKNNLERILKAIEENKQKADQLSIDGVFKEAAKLYEKVKKDRKKIEGLKKAIEKAEKKLQTITFEDVVPVKKEKKEKQWFEKFRNFETSEGFIVVCGKDASTNELLIKKHTAKEDIVFHADIQGAPFCVIKTEGRKVSENDLGEVAVISASYSKAWQRGLGAQDVYWVTPEQLSKKAPAGEFVATGAFMVYGKKNFIRKVPLKICIGIDKEGKVVAGAETFVKNKAIAHAVVIPGDDKSKEVAEKVKIAWLKKVSKENAEKVKTIPLDDIQKCVPSGKGRVISGK